LVAAEDRGTGGRGAGSGGGALVEPADLGAADAHEPGADLGLALRVGAAGAGVGVDGDQAAGHAAVVYGAPDAGAADGFGGAAGDTGAGDGEDLEDVDGLDELVELLGDDFQEVVAAAESGALGAQACGIGEGAGLAGQ